MEELLRKFEITVGLTKAEHPILFALGVYFGHQAM